jgi:catechol 2,3-dioxygenase-like lactoylglutathione lyase family enzyme
MAIEFMDHVGVVVDDLAGATDFFLALGLEVQGEGPVEGEWVDRIVGLDGIRCDIAMLRIPDGQGVVELVKFHAPAGPVVDTHQPANVPGLRHLAFRVDDIDSVVAGLSKRGVELVGEVVQYEDSFKLCYLRGPEGIIVELTEHLAH